ncbi:hypothetical protein H4582DRAFT_2153970 [Lactarius indigo]|nr:hypothetical protein H4582DRAFT_2153970 [Lactarius indigo]
MPALRTSSSRRRRSSLALLSMNTLKHGNHGIGQASPKGVTFAPNVTPVTFVEPENDSLESIPNLQHLLSFLPLPRLPPFPQTLPTRKASLSGLHPTTPKCHVPGSIETNHGSLSKIIGNCWRALPLEEKRVWEVKAKHAKAEHKQMYPNYRFRPVHNKNKERKPKALIPAEDEKRCEDVAQLLLEGMKGEELAAAVKRLDRIRSDTPLHLPRRPSSVPLPHAFPISIPALPFVEPSRPSSPQCMIPPRYTLPRRPSSAAPSLYRSWNEPFSIPASHPRCPRSTRPCSMGHTLTTRSQAPDATGCVLRLWFDVQFAPGGVNSQQELFISPLDSISNSCDSQNPLAAASLHAFTHLHSATPPVPPSTYSGSPAPSDFSLPVQAPKPQRAFGASHSQSAQMSQAKSNMVNLDVDMSAYSQGLASFGIPLDMGLSYVVPEMPPLSFDISEQLFADAIQQHQQQQQQAQQQQQQMPIVAPIAMPVDAGFNFNDVINDF